MLKENLAKLLTRQVNAEHYAAYLYLSMSAYCTLKGYMGFASWLHIQAREEMAHAMKIYQYILDRNASPMLSDIKAADADYGSFTEMFEKVSLHEKSVSASINAIATLALKELDHATYEFIGWYVTEQVEEEASADLILQKVKYIDKDIGSLLAYDAELGKRVFVDPFKYE